MYFIKRYRVNARQWLTKESRRGHGAIAARNHDADSSLHEGNRELYDLRPLFINGKRTNGHVSPVGHHLENKTSDVREFFSDSKSSKQF